MFLTLVYDVSGEDRFITFDGSPDQVQAEANGFIAGGIRLRRIVVIGEK